ncbi:MAG: hypothetical protein ACRDS9_01770 [Pseudonocardiaceae bacterium]
MSARRRLGSDPGSGIRDVTTRTVVDMEPWHEKFRRLRHSRGWSLHRAAEAFIAASDHHSPQQVENVRTSIARWERGAVKDPDPASKAAIAKMFDLPFADFWPARSLADEVVPAPLAEAEFADLVAAMRSPHVGGEHLDQATAQVERLCSEYAARDATPLVTEVDQWLRDLRGLVANGRVNLAGHGQVLELTGWLALLRSCLMWDRRDAFGSQQSRVAAAGFAQDLGHGVIGAWTFEIQAWKALTDGDLPQAIAFANAGIEAAPHASVAAQLWAQKAKAYARMQDNHKAEVALEHVRQVLDSTPPATNLRNHFNVDPTKASFYAMDTYRVLGDDAQAEAMADTVLRTSTSWDGTSISPMRAAEAQLTKATVSARAGDVDTAVTFVEQALAHQRRSAPSLTLVAREVTDEIGRHDPNLADDFAAHLRTLRR